MGVVELGAIVATCMLLLTVAGMVIRVTLRISAAENKAELAQSRADMAGINVAANAMRVETIAKLLSDHKETIAQNYVSNKALESLENRLVDAIGKLGDRIDRIFMSKAAQS